MLETATPVVITVEGQLGFGFDPTPDAPSAAEPESERREPRPILDAIKAYRDAIRVLIEGTFRDVAERLPRHFRGQCNTFILRCSDGVIVRTDAADGEPRTRYATTDKPLQEAGPWLSETVLHFPADPTKFEPADHGAHIQMDIVNFETGASRPVASGRLLVVASSKWPKAVPLPKPPARPPALVSLVNEITLHMEGSVEPVERQVREVAPSEPFLAYGRARLPALGWEAIDVYPLLPDDYWNPALAPSWAERDLLAWLAQVNAQTLRVGIDAAGNATLVAGVVERTASVGPTTVNASCAHVIAMAFSWTRHGALRFARALADCTTKDADGRRGMSYHAVDVHDVAMDGGNTLVALKVYQDADHDTPVRFDRVALAVPHAVSSIVLELDDRGHVIGNRKLQFVGKSDGSAPDASLAGNAGVARVSLATPSWIVVEHGGSLNDGRTTRLLPSALGKDLACDASSLTSAPGKDEPHELAACRRAIVVPSEIAAVRWGRS